MVRHGECRKPRPDRFFFRTRPSSLVPGFCAQYWTSGSTFVPTPLASRCSSSACGNETRQKTILPCIIALRSESGQILSGGSRIAVCTNTSAFYNEILYESPLRCNRIWRIIAIVSRPGSALCSTLADVCSKFVIPRWPRIWWASFDRKAFWLARYAGLPFFGPKSRLFLPLIFIFPPLHYVSAARAARATHVVRRPRSSGEARRAAAWSSITLTDVAPPSRRHCRPGPSHSRSRIACARTPVNFWPHSLRVGLLYNQPEASFS